MGKDCCSHDHSHALKFSPDNQQFKIVLWIALVLNLLMFFLELFFGLISKSLSLKADAIDFLGDSANYFLTLFVLHSAIKTKAKVSLMKSAFMFLFGLWILVESLMRFFSNEIPHSFTMTWVGLLALVVNGVVAFLLYKFREGDSNMQSVWLCSRNDAIGNLAVVLASFGVSYFVSKWPDLLVAIFMAALSVSSAYKVLIVARKEIQHG